MADIFTVIADPTRRELLSLLLEGPGDPGSVSASASGSAFGLHDEGRAAEISVGQLVTALGLSQPTVSKHLRVLRDAGLVRVREEGQHRYYSVDAGPLGAVDAWLAPFVTSLSPVAVPAPAIDDDGGGVVVPLRSGVSMPAPLRRAAENLPDVGDVGVTLGRVVAGAQSRIPGPLRKRLGNREQG